jgi:predicted dehydrogenase
LKLALVGCGGRGSGAANQALRVTPGIRLVAMADVFSDQIDKSASNLVKQHPEQANLSEANKFVGFDAYKQAIAEADVVILATPAAFRPLHFEEAVRQGKHVFMEKPVAIDAPGVRRVLAAAAEAKKKNLKVGVGLQRRHKAAYIETVKRIQDGALGDLQYFRAYWNSNGGRAGLLRKAEWSETEYQFRNQYYFRHFSGDIHVDQGLHVTDVINWIKGAYPVRAVAQGGNQVRRGPEYGNLFDHYAVQYEYADGARLFAENRHTQGAWSAISEHAHGTKGAADLNNDRGLFVIKGKDGNVWRYEGAKDDPYQLEHNHLFDAIRKDLPFNEAERGALSTMVCIMGRMAAYSGQQIEWEDAIKSEKLLAPPISSMEGEPPVKPGPDGLYDLPIPGKSEPV